MALLLPPIEVGRFRWDFTRTCLFGVVNVTPDSFHDGGRYQDPESAVVRGLAIASAGADVLDIGGESTRPGSTPISEQEELGRVLPVIAALVERSSVAISVDTYKASVARAAVSAGASIVNDISGLRLDEEMAGTVANLEALLVLGHLRGRPATMQDGIHFDDVVSEVADELRDSVRRAVSAGVRGDRIWIDPGIGFGKTPEQSLALLRAVGRLREEVGYPLLCGPSRKSFIGAVTGEPVEQRLMGTCAAVAAVVVSGADAIRVHDVVELSPAIRVADAIRDRRLPVRTSRS
jgi:dihydropteroate synthase